VAPLLTVEALDVVSVALLPPLGWRSIGILRVESGILLAPLYTVKNRSFGLTDIDLEPLQVLVDQLVLGLLCVLFVVEVDEGVGTLYTIYLSCSWLENKCMGQIRPNGMTVARVVSGDGVEMEWKDTGCLPRRRFKSWSVLNLKLGSMTTYGCVKNF
jgi:hypothetical protein